MRKLYTHLVTNNVFGLADKLKEARKSPFKKKARKSWKRG